MVELARQEETTVDQFVAIAQPPQVSAWRALSQSSHAPKRADFAAFDRVMAGKVPKVPPMPGDSCRRDTNAIEPAAETYLCPPNRGSRSSPRGKICVKANRSMPRICCPS